ncbi:MAG: NADPH:quinone oxidoreductase family protein [Minwuia sp.]|uniref:NADPH:quinone oxidoreductase family protein n=1 Tax=Minwuia sp. TaxID=2493630 RepID=UPI003A88D2FF
MKAITATEFGPPDVFSYRDAPDPAPAPDGIVIRVRAAGISFVDLLVAQGKYQVQPPLPYVPGTEFAGEIVAVGDQVSAFKPGDRVVAGNMGGGYADLCAVPAKAAVRMPDGMSFEHGSVFRVSYGTAYYALVQRAETQPGETVLVLGAAGAIGTACIQMAKALGARVIASASSEAKRALARQCGADEAIDNNAEDWRDQLKALTAGKGVDIVVDPVGGDVTERAFRSLGWKGRHLVVGYAAGSIPKLPVNLALLKGAALVGVDYRQFGIFEPDLLTENLARLFELYTAGKVTPPVHATHAMADFRTAMKSVIDGSATGGRVVLTNS